MKLGRYLRSKGIEPDDFAFELDVACETVRRYVAGTRVPVPTVMRRIVTLTGGAVTPNDFYDMPELRQAGRAA